MLVNENGEQKDVSLFEVNKDNYIVPQGEEFVYHCKVEMPDYDRRTGKRNSAPSIKKFGKKIFDTFLYHELLRDGYEIEVLYDPTDAIKAQHEARHRSVAEQARLAEEAKKAEFAKMREDIKAELLAEFKIKRTKKE